MTELTDLSVRQCLDGLQQGAFSSTELTRAFLERIERLEPQLARLYHTHT
jgi:Asp-tRNA(Asn)/Glu-tRNA(Gln) amidotransferase A subunit family amidase